MNFWTSANLAAVTGGRWISEPDGAPVRGLSIDSRTVRPGEAFAAIRGENFDGHDFVGPAVDAGAVMAIVDRRVSCPAPLLAVDDTVAALGQLAGAYRDELAVAGTKVIAVTGSNGKTTTRHLIHAMLSETFTGTQSPRSFNNQIGVSLTLLAASTDHDFVVTELGTNHPGEIAALARVVRPDAAVITNFGTAHIGHFASPEAIEQEKRSLLGFVRPGGLAIEPADAAIDELVRANLSLAGEHNARNASLAVAVARWMAVDDGRIGEALAAVEPLDGRLQPIGLGRDVLVLNDTYNANPDSVRAALEVLAAITRSRHVVVLGDMFELGDRGPDEHRRIGRCIGELGLSDARAVFIGELAGYAAAELAAAWPPERISVFASWSDDLVQKVAARVSPGDAVLLKASRGMGLERLIPGMEQRFGAGSAAPT